MPLTTSNGNYGSRNQGDQMIWIFAYWVIVYYGYFFK
jgi:hypothetical protein